MIVHEDLFWVVVREFLPALGTIALPTLALPLNAIVTEKVAARQHQFLWFGMARAAINLSFELLDFALVVLDLEFFAVDVTGHIAGPCLLLLLTLLDHGFLLRLQLVNKIITFTPLYLNFGDLLSLLFYFPLLISAQVFQGVELTY